MYQQDKQWEELHHSQVVSILDRLITHLTVISIASDEDDKKSATDFTVKLKGGSIAVRLRRPYYDFRDLTIRSRRANGVKTELAKIKDGFAFRYFYGWTDVNGTITEWMFVDLDKVRELGILKRNWREYENKDPITRKPDGTYFIAIPVDALCKEGCVIASQIQTLSLTTPSVLSIAPLVTIASSLGISCDYEIEEIEKDTLGWLGLTA